MENLPTWDEVNYAHKDKRQLDNLELLILNNEPSSEDLADEFRQQLLGAIKDAEIQGAEKAQRELEELKAYLRTLADFGGTLQQARELAAKAVEKFHDQEV